MYVTFHTKLLKKIRDEQPEKFIKERFYSKEFIIEDFSKEYMDRLRTAKP